MPLIEDEIRYAYRFLLGREPEDSWAIANLTGVRSWRDLREIVVSSEEFRQKAGATRPAAPRDVAELARPHQVDVDVDDAEFERLLAHVQGAWRALGEQRPHWSVLTDPRFAPERIADHSAEFYESGAQSLARLDLAVARAGRTMDGYWTCVELGCGVGRITAPLAQRFDRVVGVDVAQPHLDLAAAHLRAVDADNVELMLLDGLGALAALPPFALFYSIITLQHNPPPVMARLLSTILGRLQPGGLGYFQLPVACFHDYCFDIAHYLETLSAAADMEMHLLPQSRLFALLAQAGCRVLDVQTDNFTGPEYHSMTFLVEKA